MGAGTAAIMGHKSDETCTACQVDDTLAWRRDRDTQSRLCNRCYLRRWRQTKSSGSAVKGELKEEGAIKDELKEECKLNVEAKDEAENGFKVEVKSEPFVKAETKATLDGASTEDTLAFLEETDDNDRTKMKREKKHHSRDHDGEGETKEGKRRRLLAKAKEEANQEVNPDDLRTPEVETDTEYPQVNLEECPNIVRIESSGNGKLDGTYRRMSASSRGKPSYVMLNANSEKKPKYLYWFKKWIISDNFGTNKFWASAKDAGTVTPCEPYPHAWKVYKKNESGEKVLQKVLAMRIIDGNLYEESLATEEGLLPLLLEEPQSGTAEGHRKKRDKEASATQRLKTKEEKALAKEEAKAAKETAKAAKVEAKAAKEAAAAEAAAKKDGTGVVAKEDKSDDESEDKPATSSSEEEEESDSEDSSEDSSSEDSSVEAPASKAVVPVAAAPKSAPTPQPKANQQKSPEARMADFEARIRELMDKELQKGDSQAVQAKFAEMKKKFQQKGPQDCERITGMTLPKLSELMNRVEKEILARSATKAPKQPRGPPPKHVLEQHRREQRDGEDAGGTAMPTTPQDLQDETAQVIDGDALPHRTTRQASLTSALRKGPRRRSGKRITYIPDAVGNVLVQQVRIASFRGCGETLWFFQPGATVHCDSCERAVPQSMGSLGGAPLQSQFAQNTFTCADCMARGVY